MECRTAVTLFFQAEDGIRDKLVTGVQTCALPISRAGAQSCGGPPAQRSFPEGGGRAEQGEGRPGEPGVLVVVLDREARFELTLVDPLQLGEEFQDAEIRAAARQQGAVAAGGQLAEPFDVGASEDGAALLVLLVAGQVS